MIPKQVRDDFLSRKLESYDWVKNLTDAELRNYLKEIAPNHKFKREPFQHQLATFIIGASKPNFYFMMDMGTGKTNLTLNLLEFHKNNDRLKKALIVAPKSQHLYTWADEVKKDSNLDICVLDDSTKGRAELLDSSEADLFVVNYPGLMYLVSDYIKLKGKDKGNQVINPNKINWLSSKFQALILDESQYTKNHQSLNFKACKQISLRTPFKYLLSGTPFNDPQDLWSQFNIVDNGATLGPTLGLYRECFFKTRKNHWGGWDHKFIKSMESDLHKMIKNRSIWYSAEECQTLPKQVFNKIFVKFDEETEAYYEKLIQEIRANNKDFRVVKNAFIQMRMITSGFLGFINENNDEKITVKFKHNPKLDALLETIDNIPNTSKIVIFNEFIHSGDVISEALTKKKLDHGRLYSGTKDVKGTLERFQNNSNCRILLCNNQSGSEGLNLQCANFIISYEQPLSSITNQQGLKRIHRAGQDKTCFYYTIMVKDSVDEKIYESLSRGKDLFDSLISGEITI